MIYTESFLKLLSKRQWKPDWLSIEKSKILPVMINKFSTPFSDKENNLVLNFTKKNLNYIKFSGNVTYIAVVENEDEKRRIKNIWNKNDEMFDYVFTVDELIIWLEENCMKFDKIIMNPPYGGCSSLYAKITVEAKKHTKDLVCISPVIAYFSINQENNNKKLTDEISDKLVRIEEAPANGFGASFDKELAIFYLSDDCKIPVSFDDIFWKKFKRPELAKSIINKIKEYLNSNPNCSSYTIKKSEFNSYNFKCVMTHKRGNHNQNTGKNCWDWTTLFDEEKMKNFTMKDTDIKTPNCLAIPFQTEMECKSFVNYANDDIVMFIIYFYKRSLSQVSNLKFIPYLDFTKDWSGEDLCKEFGLTKEEYNYIKEEMKDYGWKTRK